MTKKYSHHLVSEVFYWVGVLRTRSPGDSITVALRKPLQGGGRGSQAVYKFATKGAGGLKSKDQISVKELSILRREGCKPLGSLNSLLSYAPRLSGVKLIS